MKQKKRNASKMERTRRMWEMQLMQEKGYSKETAGNLAGRIERLIDYMHYGHVVIAYNRAFDGKFCFVRATLIYYRHDFKKEYLAENVREAVMYWNVEKERWERFRIESFVEWKPVV